MAAPDAEKTEQAGSLDPDLFAPEYIPLLEAIAAALPNALIEPGGDVISGGRVAGGYFAEVVSGDIRLRLITEGGIVDAITASGIRAILVDPHDPEGTIETIKQALEEK